jgi:hypothetical protein
MAGETVPVGNGMSAAIHDALAAVLRTVIPAMFKAQQPWALMGSTASVLQGIDDYVPPDIDLVTTMEGAYIMEGCVAMCGATVRPVSFSTSERYASHFGIFEVDHTKVEVMGDLVIAVPDGHINATDHFARWSDKVRVLHFEGSHIPVVPLEWQLAANALLGRSERSQPIADYLLSHGHDAAYLEAILSDKSYGNRTLGAVRELMHLA